MFGALAQFAHHLAGRRAALVAVFLLGLAGAGVTLSTPLLGKAFVDAVATRGDFAIIPQIALALVLLALLDVVLATVSSRIHARLSADILAALRSAVFERCLTRPLDAIESYRHGDLLTRFGSDVPRVQALLVDGLIGGVQNLLFLIVAAIITFRLSPDLAAWSFLGVLLAVGAASALRHPVQTRTRRVREAMADLSHFLSERLGALRAIRFHRAEREECARLAAASAHLNREVVAFQLLDAAAKGAPGLLLTLALAWVYLRGGALLQSGTISLGTFVAFVLYQGRLFAPAQGLVGLIRTVQEARVSLARVEEIIGPDERAQEVPAPAGGGPAAVRRAISNGSRSTAVATASREPEARAAAQRAIQPGARSRANTWTPQSILLDHVAFAYPGKEPVLQDVTLRVAPGERIALFGASGAGKSTLVQLLFGLRQPSRGAVLIDGCHAHAALAAAGRSAVGYAGAEPFLLHATVEENVRYGNPAVTSSEIERALILAEADAFVMALPAGLRTVIGGRGLALSDGQRQRVGLARLFVQAPRILVLDEAFSGLDLETEARIRNRLWDAFPDRTALVVSHRPVGLQEFGRIFFLHDGRITPVSPEQLQTLLKYERAWA